MAKKTPSGNFQLQLDDVIREEALKIARATQAPEQTKEQTKLIAKGIAKGIAEYRKQEKIKQRDRARLQKKRRPPEQATEDLRANLRNMGTDADPSIRRLPGLIASGIFLLAGLLHLVVFAAGITITIGTFPVSASWSGTVGVVAVVLAVWIYRSTQQAGRVRRTESP